MPDNLRTSTAVLLSSIDPSAATTFVSGAANSSMMHRMDVLETQLDVLQAVDETVAVGLGSDEWKLQPSSVTVDPPICGRLLGLRNETTGASKLRNSTSDLNQQIWHADVSLHMPVHTNIRMPASISMRTR